MCGNIMKQNFFIILAISFLLTFYSVSATNGCFLYKESIMYCQDIDSEQAQQECTNYNDCVLQEDFVQGKGCVSINDCKKMMCKSSCKLEFTGKCDAGEIPKSKEQDWCNEGCCKFYYGSSYCAAKSNKWLCEVEARNKEAKQFAFDTQMKGDDCNNYCSVELSTGGDITQGLKLEDVSVLKKEEIKKIVKNASEMATAESSDSLGTGIWVVMILVMAGGVMYYIYNKNSLVKKEGEEEVSSINNEDDFGEELREKELEMKRIRERIEDIKEKHEFKTKGKEREEFFAEFGLAATKVEKGHLERLKELGRIYDLKKRKFSKIITGEEKKALDKLTNLVDKQKKFEQKREGNFYKVEEGVKKVEQKVEPVSKKEVEEIIAALRKMGQKK